MLNVPYDTELLMWQLSPPAEVTQACGSPFALAWAFRLDVHPDMDVSSLEDSHEAQK